MVPMVLHTLTDAGHEVLVQQGAGAASGFPDRAYTDAGATTVPDAAALFRDSDVVLKVQGPTPAEAGMVREGATLIALFTPGRNLDAVQALAARRVTSHSLELLPRT